ncbi:MAG: NAD(P)/FAD-dependent oxidoreductase [Thermoanaerobaculales bacterium]
MERIGTAVIGGGVVGCAVLYELAHAGFPDAFLFERMGSVGDVQSGRNSGVVHAGIYYAPGSLKAKLCVEGNVLMYAFCRAHGVPVENVGKLLVAPSAEDVPALETLAAQARANGAPGVRMLTREQTRALEPNVEVPAALHVPSTGIVDAARLTRTLAGLAEEAGARVLTGFEVTEVEPLARGFRLTGRRGGREETFEADLVINAAGLHCDTIAKMVNPDLDVEVVPLRGEYFSFNRRRRGGIWLGGMNVYPVPELLEIGGEKRIMVGVHLTPTFGLARDGRVEVGDTVTVGPEFVIAPARDDYETGRKPAEFFLARARRYFPNLELGDLAVDFAGIMVNLRGATDWIVTRDAAHPDCVQLLGIDSPGLTGCLAIGGLVRRMLAA